MKKKKKSIISQLVSHIKANPLFLLVLGIIFLSFFLRIYEIESRSPFGWDQIDNAWKAKNIIVNNEYPLLGMQAKGSSGIFIGPFYYYFVAIFYFITNLDPIASGIVAGVSSLFSMIVLFFILKKIFSTGVAIIALTLNGFTVGVILFERVQWPVNFIPIIGLLIFFSLYKIAIGNVKYILLLALSFGISLHIHFTVLFYPIIILLTLPFFPRTKETLKYMLFGSLIVIPFIIPIAIAYINQAQNISSAATYGQSYYHGFHLRRVIQLLNDGFIQFIPYLMYDWLKVLKLIILPIFIFIYLYKNISRNSLVFCYLLLLFFVVPWFVLSTYSGELTDYYFAINKFLALMVISYLIYRIYIIPNVLVKIIVVVLIIIHIAYNINAFMLSREGNSLSSKRPTVLEKIERGEKVGFYEGVAESYLYFYYMREKGEEVY